MHIENVHSHVFVLTRSKSGSSLKPAPGRRRPQPHLGTRWNSQRPTWSFEVILVLQLAHWELFRKPSVTETICVCVSRYDKQSVYNRRGVGEASDSAPRHPDHGCFCESQRRQAASGSRRQRGIVLYQPMLELQLTVRTSIPRCVSAAWLELPSFISLTKNPSLEQPECRGLLGCRSPQCFHKTLQPTSQNWGDVWMDEHFPEDWRCFPVPPHKARLHITLWTVKTGRRGAYCTVLKTENKYKFYNVGSHRVT